MYIIAIAWLYVALMMAITESNWVASVLTFLFYGLAPLALFLWLMGTSARKRRKFLLERMAQQARGASDPPATAQGLAEGVVTQVPQVTQPPSAEEQVSRAPRSGDL